MMLWENALTGRRRIAFYDAFVPAVPLLLSESVFQVCKVFETQGRHYHSEGSSHRARQRAGEWIEALFSVLQIALRARLDNLYERPQRAAC